MSAVTSPDRETPANFRASPVTSIAQVSTPISSAGRTKLGRMKKSTVMIEEVVVSSTADGGPSVDAPPVNRLS